MSSASVSASSASASSSASRSALEAAKMALILSLQNVSSFSSLPHDTFSLPEFITSWRAHAAKPLLCFPVREIEALDVTAQSNSLRAQTLGVFGHRFVIATVACSSERPEDIVCMRVDFWNTGYTVRFHHNRQALIDEKSSTVMKLSSPSTSTAPSIDAFIVLLDVIVKRSTTYNITLSNCISFVERIMFAAGRMYADHWRSAEGRIVPDPLRWYINRDMDEIDAGVAVGVPAGMAQSAGKWGMRAMKGAQVFLSSWQPRQQQVRWPGQEMGDIMRAWKPRTPAEL